MTIINKLIAAAKDGAEVLELPENHIGQVKEHIFQTCGRVNGITREKVEAELRAGRVKILGVPIRVVPKGEAV